MIIRRILISEELNNQERFNAATSSLVSTTKEEMGRKFKIVFGIFCIGLQSSKIEYKKLSFKPLVLALIVWLCVIPMAYFISVA